MEAALGLVGTKRPVLDYCAPGPWSFPLSLGLKIALNPDVGPAINRLRNSPVS